MTESSKPNLGFDELLASCKGAYVNTKSHSCVKEFALLFSKSEAAAFIADGLPKQIGRGNWIRTNDTNFKD